MKLEFITNYSKLVIPIILTTLYIFSLSILKNIFSKKQPRITQLV